MDVLIEKLDPYFQLIIVEFIKIIDGKNKEDVDEEINNIKIKFDFIANTMMSYHGVHVRLQEMKSEELDKEAGDKHE
jgi:hypothetical protein